MHMKKIASLVAMALVSASAFAESPSTPPMPGFKLIEHQKMTMGDKVIYEADVNLADASRRQYALDIGVDDRHWQYLTLEGSAGAVLNGRSDGESGLTDGWMISYVVTVVTPAGTARVELVYTLRDPKKHVDKTEHVHADVKLGERFVATTASGTKVWLIVNMQPA